MGWDLTPLILFYDTPSLNQFFSFDYPEENDRESKFRSSMIYARVKNRNLSGDALHKFAWLSRNNANSRFNT